MLTKREFPRYSANVPIHLTLGDGSSQVTMAEELSAAGCYFSRRKRVASAPLSVRGAHIGGDPAGPIGCMSVRPVAKIKVGRGVGTNQSTVRRRRRGTALKWKVAPADVARLDALLSAKSQGSTVRERIAFIQEEQKLLWSRLGSFEEFRLKRWQSFLAMILIYVGFLVAPAKFQLVVTNGAAACYAVAGLWASLVLLVQGNRMIIFLGDAVREVMLIRTAIDCNRAYVMSNDHLYYRSTVLPQGDQYDASRAWSYIARVGAADETRDIYTQRNRERHPYPMHASMYPTVYILVLQALFLGGTYHFLGMLGRSLAEWPPPVYGPENAIQVYSLRGALAAFSAASILSVLWIHFTGNCCRQYHRALFEARRICPDRPNPRATGHAFKRDCKAWEEWLGYGLIAAAVASALVPVGGALIAAVTQKGLPEWAVMTGQILALTAVSAFLVLKVVLVWRNLVAEKSADVCARPIRPEEV